ncbi:hypothetical protein CIB48_g7667 [Xylaria polymorpha]|nr:hypothetical protein CIB48_g7667 [Xylaria polymorpha]
MQEDRPKRKPAVLEILPKPKANVHGFTYTDVQHHSSDHGDEVTFEFQSREKQLERRAGSLAGKPYFTTDKGLIGISTALETAPIKNGDSLAVIDASPAYLVLREVKSNNDHSDAAQRHQIIARAVETESRDKMKERLVGIQRRVFQII